MNGDSKQNNLLKKYVSTKKNYVITVFTITNFITLTVVSLLTKINFQFVFYDSLSKLMAPGLKSYFFLST